MAQNNVAVVGAGLMGMCLARRLSMDGHRVTVYESADQIGGLATWQDFGGFSWDRFYHVILPSDIHLISLVRQLGLEDDLHWRRTYTGFYVDGKMYSISSNLEFLKFPLLSLLSKVRLAWTLIYGSRISDWRRLERTTSVDWLIRVSGRNTYEKFWKPLLLAKLGSSFSRVSAVFIWSYIKRLFSARDSSANAESLGHVKGGYQQIFARLEAVIEQSGGRIVKNTMVERISINPAGRIEVKANGNVVQFNKVICTSPVSVLKQVVEQNILRVDTPQADVEYLGVVCLVLVTTKPLSPYYVINIADDEIPFTGVVGMTNVISVDNTAGHHMTYLPKYILSTDEALQKSDESYREKFIDGVKKMFPEFDTESLVSTHVIRATKVQPLQVIDYSTLVPYVETRHPDLFALNTAQFFNATLNNNEVVSAVNNFYEKHSADLAS